MDSTEPKTPSFDTESPPPQNQPNASPPQDRQVMDVHVPKTGSVQAASSPPETSDDPAVARAESSASTNPQLPLPKKPKSIGLVVLVAVIVALALSGLGILAYLQAHTVSDTKTTEQSETDSEPSLLEDLEAADSEIDKALSLIDHPDDFPEDELSDESLGL